LRIFYKRLTPYHKRSISSNKESFPSRQKEWVNKFKEAHSRFPFFLKLIIVQDITGFPFLFSYLGCKKIWLRPVNYR
jgi:hypothetical protein